MEVRAQTGLELPDIKSCHACDNEFYRQKVLAAMPEKCRPCHIHSDIMDRLPTKLQMDIARKLSAEDAHLEIRRFAFQDIDKLTK